MSSYREIRIVTLPDEAEATEDQDTSEDSEELEHCRRTLTANEAKKLVGLQPDMWSVSIIILCKDVPKLFDPDATGRAFHWARFLFGAVSQITNLTLQLVILLYVRNYVSNPAVSSTQFNYKRFRSELFDKDGTFNQTAWENWGDQTGPYSDLCQSSLSQMIFTGFILFLWCARMLSEARSCSKLNHTLMKMPGRPMYANAGEMVQPVMEENDEGEQEPTGEEVICFLTHGTRIAIYVLVAIPKFLVFLLLTYYGCDWLVATESFGDLILNALALEFIIGIDELVLENFFPEGTSDIVEGTSFGYPQREKSEDEQDWETVCEYIWSAGYVIVIFLFTCFYLDAFQQVLPGYQGDITPHCNNDERIHAEFNPFCTPWSYLFNNTDCFPFGENAPVPPGLNPDAMGVGTKSRRHKKKPKPGATPAPAPGGSRRLSDEPLSVSDYALNNEIHRVSAENEALKRQIAEMERSLLQPDRLRASLNV